MDIGIDPDSPVPLFEQISQHIRYEIAVGHLAPGDELPSVRSAAEQWGIHYLTVRRAYSSLCESGLLTSRRGVGTSVAGPGSRGAAQRGICVVECNEPQASDYAAQIAGALGMPVGTILLDDSGPPPPGRIVGSYFHFNDIRARWPNRGPDFRFVSVFLDPDILGRLNRLTGEAGSPVRIRLLETDRSRAHNALPDLHQLLSPDRYRVDAEVVDDLSAALRRRVSNAPVLLAPRLWQQARAADLNDEGVILMRYLIAPPDLARLRGEDLEGSDERTAKSARAPRSAAS